MSLLRYTNGNGAPKLGVVKVKIECTMQMGAALDLFSTANDVTHLEVTPIGKPTVVLKSPAEAEKKVVKGKKARKPGKVMDTRAAWRKDRKQGRMVLNVSETLKNLGLSENELLTTPAQRGTLEHSLKRTVIQRRAMASR
mgnify:FL=1|jgi:hypothetical protein|tara:strand:- start:1469 stop:1888 length:420 start_codon:yes stop_codon:yes gene_type:complete